MTADAFYGWRDRAIALAGLGDRWLRRVRWQFAGWPIVDPDVDDAIG